MIPSCHNGFVGPDYAHVHHGSTVQDAEYARREEGRVAEGDQLRLRMSVVGLFTDVLGVVHSTPMA